jgi:predicted glutamine amidotransferase
MCRLYGFRANEPTKVECSLVYAQNALLAQSISDLRGEAHPDGWGISCYLDHTPTTERRDTAAHEDERFSIAAERAYAETIIAHVRKATVGGHSISNTHPFIHGVWTFAHNGTLRGFSDLADELMRETDADLARLRHGETDSEAVFLWLLTRIREADGGADEPRPDVETLVGVVAESLTDLDGRSKLADTERPSRLNFVLTDGRTLIGSCLRNSLHWVERHGIHDCEICGIPHVRHDEHKDYRAVVLASEPISHEDWQTVPDGSVLAVDESMSVSITGL